MNDVANLKLLPKEKFRVVETSKNESVREYEVKKGNLRLYLIKLGGYIIVIGGKKNAQEKDLKELRAIKRRYLQSNPHPI